MSRYRKQHKHPVVVRREMRPCYPEPYVPKAKRHLLPSCNGCEAEEIKFTCSSIETPDTDRRHCEFSDCPMMSLLADSLFGNEHKAHRIKLGHSWLGRCVISSRQPSSDALRGG